MFVIELWRTECDVMFYCKSRVKLSNGIVNSRKTFGDSRIPLGASKNY